MKKLVIFDLDGTLIDTIADLAHSTNHALKACGYPEHATEEYYHFVGNGIDKLFERALPETARTRENVLRIRTNFLPHYDLHNTDLSRPYQGIPELLQQLKEEGYQLAVASNKYQRATEHIISRLLPGIPFQPVFGQRENVPRKPDPTVVHEILSLTATPPEEALYVGDSDVDMQTALSAGVTACAVTWGFRSRSELEIFHPRYMADTPQDIYRALLQEKQIP